MTRDEIMALSQAEIDAIVERARPEPPEVVADRGKASAVLQRGLDIGAFTLGPKMQIIRNPSLEPKA